MVEVKNKIKFFFFAINGHFIDGKVSYFSIKWKSLNGKFE